MSVSNGLAKRPPMGWNSYDCFGCAVTEEQALANARYMARHLRHLGWEYVVLDAGWFSPNRHTTEKSNPMEMVLDEYGRMVPQVEKFPSSAGGKGLKPLADQVHAMGLKFGIHLMRGIPRKAVELNLPILGTSLHARDIANTKSICEWSSDNYGLDFSKPEAGAYYDSLVALAASWGVDFLKYDDMGYDDKLLPNFGYYAKDIEAVSKAIQKSGRPMLLSLSPGLNDLEETSASHRKEFCEMWRVSADFWDRWTELKVVCGCLRRWGKHAGAGHWPDGDMLPLGKIGITHGNNYQPPRQTCLLPREQVLLMSQWVIARSPLFFGGNLPENDEFTLSLINNPEVIAVNQQAENSRVILDKEPTYAWASDGPGSSDRYLALFNMDDDQEKTIKISLGKLGLSGKVVVRDLWERKDIGTVSGNLSVTLDWHSSKLYRLSRA